jgi:hypothetical protein
VRALAARMLLSLLAVVGLTAVALLRLARVPRPEAVVVGRYAGGRLLVERITLGRRRLGHTVRCDGSELLSRFGEGEPRVREASTEAGGVWEISEGPCRLTVTLATCRGVRSAGCGGSRRTGR